MKITDPNWIIKKFGLKTFGGSKDFDFDGVPNKLDCQPKNTFRQDKSSGRIVEIINSGKGIKINNPDGLEIQILQDKPNDFEEYARELAIDQGLKPGGNLRSVLGKKPSRIVVTW